jgi:hypothetical protein
MMKSVESNIKAVGLPKLSQLSSPVKALATAVIVAMGIALMGALGQIIVHDVLPTFFQAGKDGTSGADKYSHDTKAQEEELKANTKGRGDLFADVPSKDPPQASQAVYKNEQFLWLLKWTHIHLFGMAMIFIFMGGITIFLDVGIRARLWLVVLPFIGVFIDITAMWLKAYLSPVFFWLHIPGGGLFVTVYSFVSIKALTEMWLLPLETGERSHDDV